MKNRRYLSMVVAVLFGIIITGCDNPHFTSGKEQMELKNYKNARDELLQVVNEKPDHDEANFLIAQSYFYEGNFLKAIEWVQTALKINPADEKAENLRTNLRQKGIEFLGSSDSADQAVGIQIIEKLPSKEAVPNLKKALSLKNEKITPKAETLLKNIAPSELRSEWIKMLQSNNRLIKEKAAEKLWDSEHFQGASSILRNKYGTLFLDGDESAGKKLIEFGKKESASWLIKAMGQKDKKIALQAVAIAKNLTPEELDVNNNSDGKTALLLASKHGHTEAVKLLLDYQAKINIKDEEFGLTALMYASKNGHEDVVNQLIKNGANVNAETSIKKSSFLPGWTALNFASFMKHEHIIKMLKDAGANVGKYANIQKVDASMLLKFHK